METRTFRSKHGDLVRGSHYGTRTDQPFWVLVFRPGSAEQVKHAVTDEELEGLIETGQLVEKG